MSWVCLGSDEAWGWIEPNGCIFEVRMPLWLFPDEEQIAHARADVDAQNMRATAFIPTVFDENRVTRCVTSTFSGARKEEGDSPV